MVRSGLGPPRWWRGRRSFRRGQRRQGSGTFLDGFRRQRSSMGCPKGGVGDDHLVGSLRSADGGGNLLRPWRHASEQNLPLGGLSRLAGGGVEGIFGGRGGNLGHIARRSGRLDGRFGLADAMTGRPRLGAQSGAVEAGREGGPAALERLSQYRRRLRRLQRRIGGRFRGGSSGRRRRRGGHPGGLLPLPPLLGRGGEGALPPADGGGAGARTAGARRHAGGVAGGALLGRKLLGQPDLDGEEVGQDVLLELLDRLLLLLLAGELGEGGRVGEFPLGLGAGGRIGGDGGVVAVVIVVGSLVSGSSHLHVTVGSRGSGRGSGSGSRV
mmetsp:Transcript_17069/g.40487  ORF Transcript_17069/g.40487 Transcript_17069/m.40487 type:complete len:326 (-) Transcript_17069:133-1110(-)